MNKEIKCSEYILEGLTNTKLLLSEVFSAFHLQKCNQSLLFEPQIAETTLNLLNNKNDELVSQLVSSLAQTSVDHIKLKQNYNIPDINNVQQEIQPELLQAILNKNPNVFNSKKGTSQSIDASCTSQGHHERSSISPQYHQQEDNHQEKLLMVQPIAQPQCLQNKTSNILRFLLSEKKQEVLTTKQNCTDTDDIFSALAGTKKIKKELKTDPIIPQEEKPINFSQVSKKPSESMESNSCNRFINILETILEKTNVSLTQTLVNNDQINVLLQPSQIKTLFTEIAKLKLSGAMDMIPIEYMMSLLNILETNIRVANEICLNDDPKHNNWFETHLTPVMRAADAGLCIFYIMTSPNIPNHVYSEDTIDIIILFIKFQLHNTIFPYYDTINQNDPKKRNSYKTNLKVKSSAKYISILCSKISELITLVAEILKMQEMTDNIILHATSISIAPFFAENICELQLSCLKLATAIFNRYEKQRNLFIDEFFISISRLPNSKHNLRLYQLKNSNEQIQMVTALVLQLVQGVVYLPEHLIKPEEGNDNTLNEFNNKYEAAATVAATFLCEFLNKCSSKSDASDYRILLENIVQDLLKTIQKPEWPASGLLLNILCNILMKKILNNNTDLSLRIILVDYLGTITAQLRKYFVFSQSSIEEIIKSIKPLEEINVDNDLEDEDVEEYQIKLIQRFLLNYLIVYDHTDEVYKYARQFYLTQWYRDAVREKISPTTSKTQRKKLLKKIENRKKFYIKHIKLSEKRSDNNTPNLQTIIDNKNAELISQYLNSKRPLSKNFDAYLRTILFTLRDNSILLRIKALKCLKMVVEADPSVLGENEMQIGVSRLFSDQSVSVRETAIDLVGKIVLNKTELIDKYYDMISARILDTGVSVRKRVIRIFKDICVQCPQYQKIPEICIKMIKRMNDEESICKLVLDTFQTMWFNPFPEKTPINKSNLHKIIMNIIDVFISSTDTEIECFEQLLAGLLKSKQNKLDSTKLPMDPPNNLLLKCQQIVDYLIEYMLHLEESTTVSNRFVTCFIILKTFAKIRPQLLVKHASTLQPYLSVKCQSKDEYIIVSSVAHCLEFIIPFMKHPSQVFLAQLEEDSVKLIIKHNHTVISSCMSCLGSIINNVTHNFQLIRDCFTRYYGIIIKYKDCLERTDECTNILINCKPLFRRALFIIGLLLKHFDFTNKEIIGDISPDITDKIFQMLLYFLQQVDEDIQINTLETIGNICIGRHEFMLHGDLKKYYNKVLTENISIKLKIKLFQNIEMFLMEEENRFIKMNQKKTSNEDSLKEIDDRSSSVASTIIQLYLKDILKSYIHGDIDVRRASLQVIQLIIRQGLVHPLPIVPYLICMSTDFESIISYKADTQLSEINKKYPGLISTQSQLGIRLSYQLQKSIQKDKIIRGFLVKEKDKSPIALNSYVYTLIKNSWQQRRSLTLYMLKQFDERADLSYLLYLADNLAYFPYTIQDELLFIIHYIDLIISSSGNNLLQDFRENLISTVSNNPPICAIDEADENEEALIARLPNNTANLQSIMNASQGFLILLGLKQYLKDIYGLTDKQMSLYSPSQAAKTYNKSITRKSKILFNPNVDLNKLQQEAPSEILDTEGKNRLIAHYLHFKELILKIDLDVLNDIDNSKICVSQLRKRLISDEVAASTTDVNNPNEIPKKIPRLVVKLEKMFY